MNVGRGWLVAVVLAGAGALGGGGCWSACFAQLCGNGMVDGANEECDDGNDIENDGCNTRCEFTCTFNCGTCGDCVLDLGEQCDDCNLNNDDGCNSECLLEVIGACGDGVITLGEQCDDGNNASGDGCDAFCRLENLIGACGNGVLEAGEYCDTMFGCNPDCVYSCTQAACLEPLVDVDESMPPGMVSDPMVAHEASSLWAVAWRREIAGSPATIPATVMDGSASIADIYSLDAMGAAVASPSLAATPTGYLYASTRVTPGENREVRLYDAMFGGLTALQRPPASWVAAGARTDNTSEWIGTTDGNGFHVEELTTMFSSTRDGASSLAAPPALAVLADGSVAAAFHDDTYGFLVFTFDPVVVAMLGFAGTWDADGPAVASLTNRNFVVVWHDTMLGDVELFRHEEGAANTTVSLTDGDSTPDAAPDAASDASGNIVVAWSVDEAGCRRIRVLVLDSLAQPYATPFEPDGSAFIGSGTDCSAREPSVAIGPGGEVVLAWSGCVPGIEPCPAIFARRFPGLVP